MHLERWQALTPAQQRSFSPPQRLAPATTLDAGELVPGLQIDLAEIWQA